MISIKSENVVAYAIHMDIEIVSEEILKCGNVILTTYPLNYPGR
jgi:hypothetical protein